MEGLLTSYNNRQTYHQQEWNKYLYVNFNFNFLIALSIVNLLLTLTVVIGGIVIGSFFLTVIGAHRIIETFKVIISTILKYQEDQKQYFNRKDFILPILVSLIFSFALVFFSIISLGFYVNNKPNLETLIILYSIVGISYLVIDSMVFGYQLFIEESNNWIHYFFLFISFLTNITVIISLFVIEKNIIAVEVVCGTIFLFLLPYSHSNFAKQTINYLVNTVLTKSNSEIAKIISELDEVLAVKEFAGFESNDDSVLYLNISVCNSAPLARRAVKSKLSQMGYHRVFISITDENNIV